MNKWRSQFHKHCTPLPLCTVQSVMNSTHSCNYVPIHHQLSATQVLQKRRYYVHITHKRQNLIKAINYVYTYLAHSESRRGRSLGRTQRVKSNRFSWKLLTLELEGSRNRRKGTTTLLGFRSYVWPHTLSILVTILSLPLSHSTCQLVFTSLWNLWKLLTFLQNTHWHTQAE